MELNRNNTGASSDFSSFNFAPQRLPADALPMPWEDPSFGYNSDNILPPLGPGTPIPSTPEKTNRKNRPFNDIQCFKFSTSGPGNPPSSFPTARPASNASFPQSAPSGAGLGEDNPLARFYHDPEQPWNPIGNDPAPPAKRGAASQTARPNFDAHSYRTPPQSELESIDTGIYQSDSGYHTHSVGSAEAADCPRDLPSQFTDQFNNTFTPFALNMPSLPTPTSDRPEAQHLSRTPSSRSKGPLETCKVCGETPKCPSDFKKHMFKHEKPHLCKVLGCNRTKGFTTANDLIRHQKSVHKMHSSGKTKSYRCASATCKTPRKEWPRLDNFKQHIVRMHSDEDVQELIDRSELKEPSNTSILLRNALAGMDPATRYPDEESFISPASLATRNDAAPLIQGWNSIQSQSRMEVEQDKPSARRTSGTSGTQASETRSSSVHSLLSAPAPIPMPTGTSTHASAKSRSSRNLNALADLAVADASRRHSGPTQPSPTAPELPPAAQPFIEQIAKQSEKSDGLSSIATFLASQIRVNGSDSLNGSDNLDAKLQAALRELTQKFQSSDKPGSSKGETLPARNQDLNRSAHVQSQNDSSSSDEGSINLEELKRGLQTLASVIRKPKKRFDLKTAQKKICPLCRKVLGRTCDMNKHMKRHTRPYGCTFSKCPKEFGSKNDWKRHENSLHFQIELYRCQIPDPSTAARYGHCAQIFYSREDFEQHLVDRHQCARGLLPDRIKEARIGRNYQMRYWCGFCRKIVGMQEQGVQGWDERYNHIDAHFKKGERIDDWVDAEANKTKREMLRESRSKKSAGDSAEDDDEDDSPKGSPTSGIAGTPGSSSAFSGSLPDMALQPSGSGSGSVLEHSRKRKPDAEASHGAKAPKGREWVIFCCQCTQGPHAEKLYPLCLNCDHDFSSCSNCPRKAVRTGVLDLDVSTYAGG